MSWALHNALKGWTLYDLNIREIQLLIKSMSMNEMKLARISQKGDSVWASFDEKTRPEFFEKLISSSEQYPSIDHIMQAGVDTEYFAVQPIKVKFPRLHTRYEIRTACFVYSTTRQFHTTSVDLSEGGLHFKDIIPDWIAGYFIVGVHSPEGIIQLMCSLVEDQKEKRRVQIVSEESDPQYLVYKDWLTKSQAAT